MDWDAEYQRKKTGASSSGASSSRQAPQRSRSTLADDNEDEEMGSMPPPTSSSFVEDPLSNDTTMTQLMRYWMNERNAPDILPAEEILLAHLLDHVRRQTDTIQLLRGDPSSSTEEEHIRIMLVQTEVERVKFVIRSYVRTRLFKIEKFARFIVTNAEIQSKITTAEMAYATRHARLTDKHLFYSVLQSLPESQSHLDDTPMMMPPMITEPDKSRPVFVHALRNCPPCRLPDGTSLDLPQGQVTLTPYFVIESLLKTGDIELV